MGLEEYRDSSQSVQKQTHITMANPDHPDNEPTYASEEVMRNHFQAANAVQDSQVNRRQIVGDFLVAVERELHNEESEAVREFLMDLQE
ncbi:MAG: hypothetical protein J07AB43_02270 [Candidatus Nanosalina sp. J07AB43]|jgi:hypothetical protein|nr:MAG: hypothetical protein J07AB43_02270 [Candidatus Nanosalina sp. J07AB43]